MRDAALLLILIGAGGYFSTANSQTRPQEASPKSSKNITVKYESENDLTTVSLKPFTITRDDSDRELGGNFPAHQMDFDAWFSHSGKVAAQPNEMITFRFRCTAANYLYLRSQEIIIALDRRSREKGRAFSLGQTSYKSHSPKFNSVFEEVMEMNVPADALRKMAAAETLEIYLGPLPFAFTSRQLNAVKELAGLLRK